MRTILEWLFGTATFPPMGECLLWRPDLIALNVTSDLLIALSYIALPFGIVWFTRHRRDLLREHRVLAGLFGSFILLCGITHLIEVITLWYPIYGFQGVAKAATAAVSSAAVAFMWPLLPGLVRLPSQRQLQDANERLRQEVAAHEATLRELEAAQRELESRVTERTNELSLVKARFEAALRGSHVTVFTQDRDLRYTSITNAMLGHAVEDIIGRTDGDVLREEGRDAVIAMKQEALTTGRAKDSEVRLDDGAALRWFDLHVEPLRDVTGELVGLTCAAVDVTERKEGEAHLRMLMRELTHRSKNLLAVIQAMARQTARHAQSTEAFLEQFNARLQALATSHDLLVQEGWHSAPLGELIRSQLGHYFDRRASQFLLDGPHVLLKPEATQSLGLALHELAINAAKYGALSTPDGRVAIKWARMQEGDGAGVEILWTESGGPAVASPQQRGFGSLVIERNLARSVEANVDLSFMSDGVRCRILIPREHLFSPAKAS